MMPNARFARDPSLFSGGKQTEQQEASAPTYASLAPVSRTAANAACSISPSVYLS
jgi:hypothetical protein